MRTQTFQAHKLHFDDDDDCDLRSREIKKVKLANEEGGRRRAGMRNLK